MKIDNIILVDKDIEFKKRKKIINEVIKNTNAKEFLWPSNYLSKKAKELVKYPVRFDITEYQHLFSKILRVYHPNMTMESFNYGELDTNNLTFNKPRDLASSVDYFLALQYPMVVQRFFAHNMPYSEVGIPRVSEVPREALIHALILALYVAKKVYYVTDKDVVIPDILYVNEVKFVNNQAERLSKYEDDDYFENKKSKKVSKTKKGEE